MKMKMEKDPFPQRQYSSLYACMGSSPSWFPSSKQQQLSKFHLLRNDHHQASNNNSSRSRSWREALKRLLKDGKSFYSSKPISTFGYDAVSYSKNFDDGCWKEAAPTPSSSC